MEAEVKKLFDRYEQFSRSRSTAISTRKRSHPPTRRRSSPRRLLASCAERTTNNSCTSCDARYITSQRPPEGQPLVISERYGSGVEASSVGERSQTIGRVSGERSMKRTAQLLVLICVLLPLPARAQHWAEYRPDGIGYSIELPGEWSVETTDVDTASGVSKSYRATVVIESRAYMTMYSSIPEDAVRKRTITTMLDGARDGAVKNVEGTLRSEEKVLISNLPARYVIVDCPKNVVLAARFFLLGNILVQGLVAGPPGIESESATKRMLGSLKVVKR